MQYPDTHANVGHDPDEDFMKNRLNLGKMRHSKATLKTMKNLNRKESCEIFILQTKAEGGVKWILPIVTFNVI